MAETGGEFPFKLGLALSFYVPSRALNLASPARFVRSIEVAALTCS